MDLSSDSIQVTGTADQIAARLRVDIETGVLKRGTALNQVALAARFGLSRIPVREALRLLAAEGYLQYRPNKGAIVAAALTPGETLEILEIRECLEHRLMDHAVANLTASDLRRAEAALEAFNTATADEVVGLHRQFHAVLFAAAARPQMAGIIDAWRFRANPRGGLDARGFSRAAREVHRRLLSACARRDRRAVRRCVRDEYAIIRVSQGVAPAKRPR
jgi:DNA-binding GntR family transcriptional regulator